MGDVAEATELQCPDAGSADGAGGAPLVCSDVSFICSPSYQCIIKAGINKELNVLYRDRQGC